MKELHKNTTMPPRNSKTSRKAAQDATQRARAAEDDDECDDEMDEMPALGAEKAPPKSTKSTKKRKSTKGGTASKASAKPAGGLAKGNSDLAKTAGDSAKADSDSAKPAVQKGKSTSNSVSKSDDNEEEEDKDSEPAEEDHEHAEEPKNKRRKVADDHDDSDDDMQEEQTKVLTLAKWNKICQNNINRKARIKELQTLNEEKEIELAAEKRKNKEIEAQLEKSKKEYADLQAAYKQKMAQMGTKRGKKGSKSTSTTHLQSGDVNTAIDDYIKEFLFRRMKFANCKKDINLAMKMIWDAIKDKLKLESAPHSLDLKEFTRIYASAFQKFLSGARQYIQTRGQTAARGTNSGLFTLNPLSILPLMMHATNPNVVSQSGTVLTLALYPLLMRSLMLGIALKRNPHSLQFPRRLVMRLKMAKLTRNMPKL